MPQTNDYLVMPSLSMIYFFYSVLSIPAIVFSYILVNDGVTVNTSKLYCGHAFFSIVWGLLGIAAAIYALTLYIAEQDEDRISNMWQNKLGQNAKDFFEKVGKTNDESGMEAYRSERATNSLMIMGFLLVLGLLILLLGVFKACIHRISNDYDMKKDEEKYEQGPFARTGDKRVTHQQVVFNDNVDYFRYQDEMTKLIMQHNERRRQKEQPIAIELKEEEAE